MTKTRSLTTDQTDRLFFHLNFCHSVLFRISCFVLRISDLDIPRVTGKDMVHRSPHMETRDGVFD